MNQDKFEELVFLWNEYVLEENNNLTIDAIKLKNKVMEFIESLPEFNV